MAWIEILYPGNSEMKTKLAELGGQLHAKILSCFRAVNILIDCIEKYVPGKQFEKIAEQAELSIQENCNLLIKRINEIDEYLEKKAKYLEDLIGTDLFQQLMSRDTTFKEHLASAKKAFIVTNGVVTTVVEIGLVTLIKKGMILPRVVARIGMRATCALATMTLGALALAADLIVTVIIGEVEEHELENSLKELSEVVQTFSPAADQFCDDIIMIRAKIEIMNN